jgi:histidine ammonia-lyase
VSAVQADLATLAQQAQELVAALVTPSADPLQDMATNSSAITLTMLQAFERTHRVLAIEALAAMQALAAREAAAMLKAQAALAAAAAAGGTETAG